MEVKYDIFRYENEGTWQKLQENIHNTRSLTCTSQVCLGQLAVSPPWKNINTHTHTHTHTHTERERESERGRERGRARAREREHLLLFKNI